MSYSKGFVKILVFAAKRKQIWSMCQTFESGKMVPDLKRGGDVEFHYVKDAIKLVNFQAGSVIHLF